jgi:signal transduction histidine kinase
VRELRIAAALLVPLVAGRGTVGSLLLLSTGRPFTPAQRDAARRIARRLALSLDYTRAVEEASGGRAAKTSFLAVMSHELKTPLNIILGYAELMSRGVPEPLAPATLKQVDRLRASAYHLLGMIDEVLTLARLEAGTERLRPETVDLRVIAREALAMAEELAPERALRLEARLPQRSVLLETDPVKMRQILLELLTNAVKFTPAGSITLEVRAEAEAVEIAVRDTGTGMAPDEIERAVEPFWQSDLSVTRRIGGTGLGLTVAAGLTRLLGGELTLESQPGEGTTARLTFTGASAEQVEP